MHFRLFIFLKPFQFNTVFGPTPNNLVLGGNAMPCSKVLLLVSFLYDYVTDGFQIHFFAFIILALAALVLASSTSCNALDSAIFDRFASAAANSASALA